MATPITSSPAVRAASTRAGVPPKRCIPDASLTTTRPLHPASAARWCSLPIVRTGSDPFGDMALGGPDLAATFVRHGLVDEYWLHVQPVVLGRGRRVFADDVHLDLELLETRTFGGGVVLLRYALAQP